jgi:hypothetical protein
LLPGTKDESPDGCKIYGCQATQDPAVAQTLVVTTIVDLYTWFANEAYWTLKCDRSFTMVLTGDDKDPLFDDSQHID